MCYVALGIISLFFLCLISSSFLKVYQGCDLDSIISLSLNEEKIEGRWEKRIEMIDYPVVSLEFESNHLAARSRPTLGARRGTNN